MEEEEIQAIIKKLKDNDPSLTRLKLNGACLGPTVVSKLLKEIKPHSHIVELQLRQNYLGSEGLSAVLNAIAEQNQLRAIDLRNNHLNASDLQRLWRKLQSNFTVEDIRVDEELGDADELPFQVVSTPTNSETEGLQWTTFCKQDLVQFRGKLQELLSINRRINECVRTKHHELKLRQRWIEKVPECILLPYIKILDLRNNLLSSLPLSGMETMVELEELLLDNNRLKLFPRSLCTLPKLRVLSARKNQVSSLPNSFSMLTTLRDVNLGGNDLQELPLVLGSLPHLEKVDIDDNPFIRRNPKIPIASDSFISFAREEFKAKLLPKQTTVRVFLLGNDNVGKSQIIRTILSESATLKYEKKKKKNPLLGPGIIGSTTVKDLGRTSLTGVGTDSPPPPMDGLGTGREALSGSANMSSSEDGNFSGDASNLGGIHSNDICKCTVSVTPVDLQIGQFAPQHPNASGDLTINFWNLTGDKIASSVHRFFLNDAQTIYLIVFDLLRPTEKASYIEHWLQSISQKCKDSPILLVGTHNDDKRCTKEYIEQTLRYIITRTNAETNYPNIFVYDICATNPASMKSLKKMIVDLALGLYTGSVSTAATSPAAAANSSNSATPASGNNTIATLVPESWLAIEERLNHLGEVAAPFHAKKGDVLGRLIKRSHKKTSSSSSADAVEAVQTHHTPSEWFGSISDSESASLVAYLTTAGSLWCPKGSDWTVLNPQWMIDAVVALASYKHPESLRSRSSNFSPPSSISLPPSLPASSIPTGNSVSNNSQPSNKKAGMLDIEDLHHIWKSPKFPESCHLFLLSLLEKNEIIIRFGNERKGLFIPCMLPSQPPSNFKDIWSSDALVTEQRRMYRFQTSPSFIFYKLMQILLLSSEWHPQVYWRFGIVLTDTRKTALILIFLDEDTNSLVMNVRGRQQVPQMVAISEAVEAIITTETSSSKNDPKSKYQVCVPCRHCIIEGRPKDQITYFLLPTLEAAVNKNPANATVNCATGRKPKAVRVDWLAPDVALSTFSGERIEFKDIELGNIIGEGGYATVYKGVWNDQVVAVKQVKLVNIVNTESDNVFAEFRREVQLMSGLQNENLVVLKAICMEPFCMVIEYMDKGSLYELTHSPLWREIDWPTRISIALDIAKGMAFLHGMMPPIVHRDLKSPNILMTINPTNGRYRAKVADFGLSRSLDFSRELDGRALEGNNPVWLAPEILLQQPYNEKVDVYSYGLITFEMLSGQDYFGDVAFMSDIEKLVVEGSRPEIARLERDEFGVQDSYIDIIRACWHPDPKERPSFSELVILLADLMRKMGETVDDVAAPINEVEIPESDTVIHSDSQPLFDANLQIPKRDIMKEYHELKDDSQTDEDSETDSTSTTGTTTNTTNCGSGPSKGKDKPSYSDSPANSEQESSSASLDRRKKSHEDKDTGKSGTNTSAGSLKLPIGLAPGVRAQLSPRSSSNGDGLDLKETKESKEVASGKSTPKHAEHNTKEDAVKATSKADTTPKESRKEKDVRETTKETKESTTPVSAKKVPAKAKQAQ